MITQKSSRSLAILGFHKIGKPPLEGSKSCWCISEPTFVGYLNYLREYGWQVIDLTTFLAGLEVPESLPARSALLTFDDGYRSMHEIVLPWLLRFGYPAVLFVPTDFIGGINDFDAGYEPEEAICDWDDLRELERLGVSVQSHGVSHTRFSWLDVVKQEKELRCSKALLETNLGKPVEVFAYPYGDDWTNPREELARMMKESGYQAACLYGGGPNRLPITDPYRLTRLAMVPDTDLQTDLEEG